MKYGDCTWVICLYKVNGKFITNKRASAYKTLSPRTADALPGVSTNILPRTPLDVAHFIPRLNFLSAINQTVVVVDIWSFVL